MGNEQVLAQAIRNNEFHITVGASAAANLDLTHEVRMLKAAILYADRVKLCSVTSSMLILLAAFANLDENQQIQVLPELLQQLGGQSPSQSSAIAETYRALKSKKHRNRQELITFNSVRSTLRRTWEALRLQMDEIIRKANADGLAQAIESGIVELRIFQVDSGNGVVQEYFDEVSNAVVSGSTYPLFDATTGNLIELAAKEGKISLLGNAESRSKHVGVSASLLSRLPLFDQVSVDEIIDIRNELGRPLTRFRAAMVTYARDIKSLPWTEDFAPEAEEVFLEHVGPAVLEIEDQVRSSHFIAELLTKSTTYTIAAPSILGVALSSLSQLPDVMLYSSAATGAAIGATKAFIDRHRSQIEVEQNQMYFYYQAGKLIERSKR